MSVMNAISAPVGATRERILDEGMKLLMSEGFRKLNLEDVANAAGVSRTAVYQYFDNKVELVLAIFDASAKKTDVELKAIAQGKGTIEQRLADVLMFRVMKRIEKCRNSTASIDELMADIRPYYYRLRVKHFQSETEIVAELLLEGRMQGKFAVPDVLPTAESMILATNSLTPFSLSPEELGAAQLVEERLSRLIHLLIAGVWADRSIPIQIKSSFTDAGSKKVRTESARPS